MSEASFLPLCGCFYLTSSPGQRFARRQYLPQLDLSSHTTILSTISRTTLTQVFQNPSQSENLDHVKYTFPLYDGVSVVGFKCTIGDKVITGVVKEKQQARKDYNAAVDRGETAGLLEQHYEAADCFSTRVGNVPATGKVVVELDYLGELKSDAETQGTRFTIPTVIAPRYGSTSADLSSLLEHQSSSTETRGIRILVDVAVEEGVSLLGVQSSSHPIAVSIGRTSSMPDDAFDNRHASATLALGATELDRDFIVVITSKGHDIPRALLEHHSTIPNHRALIATLVPRFSLPRVHPEIVFVADRSGSMERKIPTLVSALKTFLKSLPVGTKFNICSFGSRHEFLWPKSKTYDDSSLTAALAYVESFHANFGGTEILESVKQTVENRYQDMLLEVIIVTDGQIRAQNQLFNFVANAAIESVRFFSLGIGASASSSLVEGIARAGDGFAQFVGENEQLDNRVIRMLKAALSPHIKNYSIEVQYDKDDEEYELIESVTECLKNFDTNNDRQASDFKKKVVSLFDASVDEREDPDHEGGKYHHLPRFDVPKLIQAPTKIPPLYPFNRTNVYLLMSADTCQYTPKAIILRASSEHGPLKLEVPVQDVGTGDSLHRLAARKAILELEEGRGWLTEAQGRDGKPSKTKLEGRWDEVVEREAVRLGVQFQVAGKWCSFVAVDQSTEKTMDRSPESLLSTVQSYRNSMFYQSKRQLRTKRLCSKKHENQQHQQYPRKQMINSSLDDPLLPQNPSVLQGLPEEDRPAMFHSHASRKPKGRALGMSSLVGGLGSAALDALGRTRTRRKCSVTQHASTLEAHHTGPTNHELTSEARHTGPIQSHEERMHELISLQNFDGSWQWTPRLFAALELQEHTVRNSVTGMDDTVVATLVAIAFLQWKLEDHLKEVSEMVLEKAKVWLVIRLENDNGGAEDALARTKASVFGLG